MDTPLGKPTSYKTLYDKDLLVSIPRSLGREAINASGDISFFGVDFWNCYEVSWLDLKGKPCVRILEFQVDSSSEFLIESKSLKLYLNSFNGTKFDNVEAVKKIIQKDLSLCAKKEVEIRLVSLQEYNNKSIKQFEGSCLDDLDVEISNYNVDSDLLRLEDGDKRVEEVLFSDLLKSNCLITDQPDWASVQIQYKGKKIDHESLLKYIVSFRNHNEFHEQCVEHMFNDIMLKCSPQSLTIFAKYTRRGGIDINPLRTTEKANLYKRITRDIRQ